MLTIGIDWNGIEDGDLRLIAVTVKQTDFCLEMSILIRVVNLGYITVGGKGLSKHVYILVDWLMGSFLLFYEVKIY